MNMHRTSITDLPNPAKRIGELEAELLRVRAELSDYQSMSCGLVVHGAVTLAERNQARAERDAANALCQLGIQQHEAQEKIISELEAERDALRARLARVTDVARPLIAMVLIDNGSMPLPEGHEDETREDALSRAALKLDAALAAPPPAPAAETP